MTLLGGESLLNDATALTAFRIALAAAVGATATVGEGVLTFAVAALGGVLRKHLNEELAEVTP